MKKNCGHKKDCGCEDLPLTTPKACTNSESDCEPCVETVCQECVRNCQNTKTFTVGDNEFDLKEGEPLDLTLEKMFVFLSNVECYDVTPYTIKAINVDCDALLIKWVGKPVINYVVVYENVKTKVSYSEVVSLGSIQHRLYNLSPGTEYKIKVKSGSCESAEIIIKTKEL